jgi:catalase (peroxidase I)
MVMQSILENPRRWCYRSKVLDGVTQQKQERTDTVTSGIEELGLLIQLNVGYFEMLFNHEWELVKASWSLAIRASKHKDEDKPVDVEDPSIRLNHDD